MPTTLVHGTVVVVQYNADSSSPVAVSMHRTKSVPQSPSRFLRTTEHPFRASNAMAKVSV